MDEYNTCYENFIFIDDFNTSVEESQMENFCNLNLSNFHRLIVTELKMNFQK